MTKNCIETSWPQPAVGENSGSKDSGACVAGGLETGDTFPPGDAVYPLPQPSDQAAASGDDQISQTKKALNDFAVECARLHAENMALKQLNESMPGFGMAFEGVQLDGYLVSSCYKKTIHKTFSEAKAQAVEQAKHGFKQEVFALIKAGQALPWSTWEGEP